MQSASKILLFPLTALVLAAFFGGCGGYSQSEAVARCDIEKSSKGACFNEAAYNECVECYEECGQNCAAAESCPEQYVCPQ